MNKARVKLVVILFVLFLIAIQIFQPRESNPTSIPANSLSRHVTIPEDVEGALRRACGDCHSNRTRWPWYGQIAPFSWVVTDDVNQARHLNFDDWSIQKDPGKANELLADICKEVRTRGMPPFSYRLVHRDVALKASEIETVCRWSESFESGRPPATQP